MPPPPPPARDHRRQPLGFEELLSYLLEEKQVDSETAKDLALRAPKHRALLLSQLERAASKSGEHPSTARKRELEKSITAVDLLLAFGATDAHGEPFREDSLTQLYATKVGFPYEKLDPLKLEAKFVTSLFSKPFARKHNMLPIRAEDGALVIATFNPFDSLALEGVQNVAKQPLRLVIASRNDIQKLITEFFGFQKSVDRAEKDLSETVDLGNLEAFVRMKSEREIEASDEHVVNAVEYLFNYAFQQRASDIHIEPKRDTSIVRFRIDGRLHAVNKLPGIVHRAVINRIKTLARLDIGEKRRPQDGRIKTERDGQAVEFRISTMPVAFGEKAVLRIFDPEVVHDDLEHLGFFEREFALFQKLIEQPHGVVLVTGPTGSGKTTTLYTALRKLAQEDVNITTIEDPIEMIFERINQTAVNPATDVTFSSALRTILRQDPDIIMVGEIRDRETAQNAIQASLTGHLVFSTLHTNDAPSAVTRLLDLGIESFLLASTLSGLIAQRLVRKICDSCSIERILLPEEIAALAVPIEVPGGVIVREGEGCVACRHTGYRGRAGIFEMFEINQAIKDLIMSKANAQEIRDQARRDGMQTLREAAVQRLLRGETTFEEVVSVTGRG